MGTVIVVAVVAICAGLGAIIWWFSRAKRSIAPVTSDRRIELWALSEMRSLVFDDATAGSLLGMLGFRLLAGSPIPGEAQMPSHGAANTLSGDWHGTRVIVADWWDQVVTTSTSSGAVGVGIGAARPMADWTTVAWLEAGGFPHLIIRRSGAMREAAEQLLGTRVDFELESFNRAFAVEADDREVAFAIIDARMMAWLASAGGTPFDLELGPGGVLVRATRLLAPSEIEGFVETALEFVSRIPEHARERYVQED